MMSCMAARISAVSIVRILSVPSRAPNVWSNACRCAGVRSAPRVMTLGWSCARALDADQPTSTQRRVLHRTSRERFNFLLLADAHTRQPIVTVMGHLSRAARRQGDDAPQFEILQGLCHP